MRTVSVGAGQVAPGFEAVRSEFERNFAERGEIGAVVAAQALRDAVDRSIRRLSESGN